MADIQNIRVNGIGMEMIVDGNNVFFPAAQCDEIVRQWQNFRLQIWTNQNSQVKLKSLRSEPIKDDMS